MKRIFLLIIIILYLVTGCSGTPSPTPTPAPTNTPIPSDTPTLIPTDTPVPTSTHTATSTPSPTPTETATPTPDLAETEAAEAAIQAKATNDAIRGVIAAELESYEIDPDLGDLVYFNDEAVSLMVNQYDSSFFDELAGSQSFQDYVMGLDMTWESTGGLAGCGIHFHGENFLNGAYYAFRTLRFSGLPAWTVLFIDDNEVKFSAIGDLRFSNAIDLRQDSTNHYVIVSQDRLATLYANSKRLGVIDLTKRDKGKLAFEVFQESGETTCTVERMWIWSLE
jgi:hypothetical protein